MAKTPAKPKSTPVAAGQTLQLHLDDNFIGTVEIVIGSVVVKTITIAVATTADAKAAADDAAAPSSLKLMNLAFDFTNQRKCVFVKGAPGSPGKMVCS